VFYNSSSPIYIYICIYIYSTATATPTATTTTLSLGLPPDNEEGGPEADGTHNTKLQAPRKLVVGPKGKSLRSKSKHVKSQPVKYVFGTVVLKVRVIGGFRTAMSWGAVGSSRGQGQAAAGTLHGSAEHPLSNSNPPAPATPH
jgi:hypothetical protein